MSSGGPEDDGLDLAAAEYVLGTLDVAERESFAARLAGDDRARQAVAAWEARFAGLDGPAGTAAPSEEVWRRIEQRLGARGATMQTFRVIDGGRQPVDISALRRSRNLWRRGALLSGAAAAALAIFVGQRALQPASETSDATYVAAVNRGGDKPALIVKVDLRSGRVLVRPVAATAPAGHSLELWYIGADKTPRSMGLVASEPAHLSLPAGSTGGSGTFAVSVEPPGGSKTGSPTGPVVYAGQLIKE